MIQMRCCRKLRQEEERCPVSPVITENSDVPGLRQAEAAEGTWAFTRKKGGTYRSCPSPLYSPLRNKDSHQPPSPCWPPLFSRVRNSCRLGWRGHWHLEKPVLGLFSLLWPSDLPPAAPVTQLPHWSDHPPLPAEPPINPLCSNKIRLD